MSHGELKGPKSPGDLIREARAGLGLTQAELASRLGIKKGALTAWELDHAEPSLAVCHALAQTLDLTVNALARAAWDRRRAGKPRRSHKLGRPRKSPEDGRPEVCGF